MPEDNKPADSGAPSTPPPEELKNFKAEVSRKMSNQEAMMAELKRTNDALLAQLQGLSRPAAPATPQKKLGDLIIDDPDAAVAIIEERVNTRVKKERDEESKEMAKRNKVVQDLGLEFPEINSPDHVLRQRAVEIFNAMDQEEQASAHAYKTAVSLAAAELGVKPKSKRSADDDSYSLGGSTTGREGKRAASGKKADISERTERFAQLMGLDTSDKELRSRLNGHGRKTYTSWE